MDNPAEADFILAHGTEAIGQANGAAAQAASMQHINALLQSCAKQQVPPPMVVANPDVVTVSGSDLIPMPGTLAEYYAGLGGKVCSTPSLLWSEPSGAVSLPCSEKYCIAATRIHSLIIVTVHQFISQPKSSTCSVNVRQLKRALHVRFTLPIVDSRAQHINSTFCCLIPEPSLFGSSVLA